MRSDAQLTLLRRCVAADSLDGLSAAQMMFENMYGGFTYNYEIKARAAFCLPYWGDVGLAALVEGAERTPTSKNRSLAMEILASLSSLATLPRGATWLADEELSKIVGDRVRGNSDLRGAARRHLRRFVMSFDDDTDLALTIGTLLQTASLTSDAMTSAVFAAAAVRWMAVSESVLASYRELMDTSAGDEPEFQRFFERHPQLLDPMAFEVYAKPMIHGLRQPDFLVRRADDTYVVVEIECPAKKLVTRGNRITAETTHAIAQAADYVRFLQDRRSSIRTSLPSFDRPDALVISGIERVLSGPQADALASDNDSRHRLRVVGFDWIANRAEAVARNVVSHDVRTVAGMRIA